MKKTFLNSILIGFTFLTLANCAPHKDEHKFIEETCKDTKENPHKCCKAACKNNAKSAEEAKICEGVK